MSDRAAAFCVTLFQFERLHSVGAEALLNRIGQRAASRAPVLPKPFKLPQLLALVRQELDAPSSEGGASGDSG